MVRKHTTQTDPTVSVIIPTYNRSELLGRAIQSVCSQTFKDWELIVVDDASQDDTRETVEAFDDARIRYVRHSENQGGAAARNTGIEESKGEYLAFLDSDDRWLERKLERQIQVFRKEGEKTGLVYTGLKREGVKKEKQLPRYKGWIADKLFLRNPIGSCSVGVVRSSIAKEIGGFDESLPSAQDKDFWLRILQRRRASYLKGVYVIKKEGVDNNQISRSQKDKCEGRLKFYNKHKKLFGSKKRAIYLKKMGRLFRTHCEKYEKISRLCYLMSAKENVKAKRLDISLFAFLGLSYTSREFDLGFGRMYRRFKSLVDKSVDIEGYKK